MLESLHLDNVKRISPGFWSAIAGAAAAGAIVFADNRILGALALGGGMFLVALQLTPCCDGCAQGKGCGGDTATPNPLASTPSSPSSSSPAPGGLLTSTPTNGTSRNPMLSGIFADLATVANRGNRGACS